MGTPDGLAPLIMSIEGTVRFVAPDAAGVLRVQYINGEKRTIDTAHLPRDPEETSLVNHRNSILGWLKHNPNDGAARASIAVASVNLAVVYMWTGRLEEALDALIEADSWFLQSAERHPLNTGHTRLGRAVVGYNSALLGYSDDPEAAATFVAESRKLLDAPSAAHEPDRQDAHQFVRAALDSLDSHLRLDLRTKGR